MAAARSPPWMVMTVHSPRCERRRPWLKLAPRELPAAYRNSAGRTRATLNSRRARRLTRPELARAGRVSLRARRLFRVARVRPALFLYAAGSSRGASFNHGRRRSQRGEWTVITIQGGDLAAAIGSRPIRYRSWDRAVVVIGAAGYRGPATITSGVVPVSYT